MMSDLKKLIIRFKNTRRTTFNLCIPLKEEDYIAQPVEDVSPPKWHLAHTSWFFEVFVLEKYKPDYQAYNPHYHYLYNSYYESLGQRGNRSARGDHTRPGISEIIVYREHVDNEILELLETGKTADPRMIELMELGIHHEQQHQELLLTDIKYILGVFPTFSAYSSPYPEQGTASGKTGESYIEISPGLIQAGYAGKGFCFDNELPGHPVYLSAFRICNRLVSNSEYMEFIEAGAYGQWQHWLSDGWAWLNNNRVQAPLYWQLENKQWYYYTLSGYRKVDLHAPVCHISYYEAEAYASWKRKRLPTEFEWEAACDQLHSAVPGSANLLEKELYSPVAGTKTSTQFYGDVWEWTGSAYLPYPGYRKAPGAIGEYNGKFMINQMVLRGGSCATAASHIRSSYRNFFHADKRWQFTGIRLAESLD